MLTTKKLDLSEAETLIKGAAQKAVEIDIPMCIAVVDDSGTLVSFSKMDGAKVSSVNIAIDKAFTAAAARNPTSFYSEICVPGHPTFGIHVSNGGRFCVIGGGIPVLHNEAVVGGIGVSSGTPDQDIACAQAGVDLLTQQDGWAKG